MSSPPPRTDSIVLAVRSIVSVTQAGGAIFSGHTATGEALRVVADHKVLQRVPGVGEVWEVDGERRQHTKYGEQIHAARCRFRMPTGALLVDYLASNREFARIGYAKAKRLSEAFGEGLATVLTGADVEALAGVVSREDAETLISVWAAKRAEGQLIAYLDEHGFDLRIANRITRVWGDRAMEMLEVNPYFMLSFSGWAIVDAAATKLGVGRNDERRHVGAVEAALNERLQQSHTLTSRDTLLEAVGKRLGRGHAANAIALALAEGAISGDEERGYQPAGAAELERGVAARIRSMLSGEYALQGTLLDAPVGADWIEAQIDAAASEHKVPLSDQQKAAVLMAIRSSFSLLTGGAGVGKTTVLRIVIAVARVLHINVVQMAVAGRAAKRMSEATDHPAMTIAKFLAGVKKGSVVIDPYTLIIVDEASMLDLATAYRIFQYLPDGTRMLLVGDPAQLPPIGFGLVFHRLVEDATVPRTHLTRVHRQAASSGIPAVADSVLMHEPPAWSSHGGRGPGVSVIECAPGEILGNLLRVTGAWEGDDWQIIGSTRKGDAGNDSINWVYHEHFAREVLPGWRFAKGDPVMHLVNDYDTGLMNGTLGRIVGITTEPALGLEVDFEEERHLLPVYELAERVELAYAITVHKAQGSQFHRIAVPIVRSRILDHALVYTALTRAVEQVVFIGDVGALNDAIRKPPFAQNREVGFRLSS